MGKRIAGISVIMPAHNSSTTIDDSIQSVINQSYKNWELLIVDDCSNDDTSLIVENYTKKFANIKMYRKNENVGVAAARNFAVNNASFSWIAFIDSDDLWNRNKLEKQVSLANENVNTDLFYTGSAFINDEGEKQNYILKVPRFVNFDQLLLQNIISCSSVLVKKDVFLKNKMPESDDIHEDFVAWLQILSQGKVARGVQEPLLIYRLASHSKSSNKFYAMKMNWNAYRYLSIPLRKRIKVMSKYIGRSLAKYVNLYRM